MFVSAPVTINAFALLLVPLTLPSTASSKPSLSMSFFSVPSALIVSTKPFPSSSTPPASTKSGIPSLSESKSK